MSKHSIFVLIYLLVKLLHAQDASFQRHIQIDIYPYLENGIQKASALPKLSSESELRAFQRRFDYLILNVPDIHLSGAFEQRIKIFNLYPDSIAMRAAYLDVLSKDFLLRLYFNQTQKAIHGNLARQDRIEKHFNEQELFQVAARFFYIDSVFADSTFQTHICIGINGVDQINSKKDLTLLAAFCYEAIFTDFDKEVSAIDQVFEKHKKELTQKIKSGENNMADLKALRYELYTLMAKDHVFQKVLLDTYDQNKFNLAFKIKPNNAYVFHLIPSVKDNIYGIAIGPIGSEAICNVIKLRRTHGINIQLIGQGLFIPMNRNEFAFERILLPLDSSFFSTENTRALHNGLLLSTTGTYTDITNGLVLSAGCSFGRKVNGFAFNLFCNKYYIVNGVELGIQNQAHKVNGLQIGLFNRCVEINGLQIGLWNVNEKRKLPLINW